MTERAGELRAILADVRARWQRQALLRAWLLGAATAAAMLMVGVLAVGLVASEGIPLVLVVAAVALVAFAAFLFALLPLRLAPSDRQIARFIEEHAGGLDDVLVTAVDKSGEPTPIAGLLVGDAIRAARAVRVDDVVSHAVMRRAAAGALAGSLAFAAALWFFAPPAGRAINVAGSYLFPHRYAIDVRPGSIKVREGEPVTVIARIPRLAGGLVPMLTVGRGGEARSARMTPGTAPDEFTITLNNIAVSFPYLVTAGSAASPEYNVTVIRPVRISSIDVRYDYPRGIGLEPHTEDDGGDIFAPAGTRVQLTINTDKEVSNGQLRLGDGQLVDLKGHHQVFTAELTVARDGSYRVALNDIDGLKNEGDTEYFIRMLNDRPPDVRILRPAGDKQVSPLEEVVIEARADDDYGVRSLELVIKSNTGQQKVVPLDSRSVAGAPPVAAGQHTVFLEDLNVKPGDVVTYHARATDVGRGRRSTESRSDIFFLEIKPYEEEFVAAESNAGGMAGEQTGLEDLIAQQKDIMAATWKLDARARRGGPHARSPQDIRAVGQAQAALREKTEEVAQQMSAQMAQQRRRLGARAGLTRPGDEPLPRAVQAMARSAAELERLNVAAALPHEEQALAELLKAAAEIRRRQIQMQQARGGGNGNRNQPDLSTLFDQQLRKQQQTNYETQSTTQENNEEKPADADPLAAIRELARRQEALSRQQRDLASNQQQLNAEEVKRQLARLTREQEELRQQAEALSKQMQGGAGGQGGQRASGGESQQLREISEEMRQAAGDLRNQDPQQAGARGAKAGEQLRGLEQRLQGTRPEERRRAMGDMQLEARQLADAERRLGNEAARTAAGAAGDDARRRLAAEQERLADRTERLGASAKELARSGDENERQAMSEAGREIDQQKLASRMRESAQAMRSGSDKAATSANATAAKQVDGPEELARALEQVANRLGAVTGGRDGETARLSEQLSRTQELRDRLERLQRSMGELEKQGAPGAQGAQAAQPGSQGPDGSTGQQGASAGGRGSVERLQREVDNQLRDAQKLAEEIGKQNPGMEKGGTTPEQWQRSVSAPGTEGFKQDFAKWESLKKNLLVALEHTESQLAEQLRARETKERLNAGRHDAVADSYRELVDRYYQSLAAPRRPVR